MAEKHHCPRPGCDWAAPSLAALSAQVAELTRLVEAPVARKD